MNIPSAPLKINKFIQMKGKQQPAKKHQEQPQLFLANSNISALFGKNNWKSLFAPVDASSIVFFRILFGLIMLYEVSIYLSEDLIARYWLEPTHHFTYFPFDFLSPLPGKGMYYLFYLMVVLSICIILGLFYRISMMLFWCCFSYTFLLEQTRYLNHFYLVILVCFVMIFVPANTTTSLDSRLFKNLRSETIPLWSLWLMRFMIAVPYFYGGIAKINSDWLQGEPLKIWLRKKDDLPEFVINLFQHDLPVLFMAYSGMCLDLFIVPALLFEKTRKWGFLAILLFHLMNSQLFSIGIFPPFMIAATSLFFNPDWFRKIINYLTGNSWKITNNNQLFSTATTLSYKQKITVALLVFWASIQIILPLRHFFVPGSVHWTEEGHRYSWHMKLRTKRGIGVYTAKNIKTGETEIVNVDNYLNKRQKKKMSGRPYLIWQFCQMVKKEYAKNGKEVAVFANVKATLNGRKYQQLIDSTIDIASANRPIFPVSWIIPLHTPLSDKLIKNVSLDGDDTNSEGGD